MEKKKKAKRLLSFFLAAAMVLSMCLGVSAAPKAENDTKAETKYKLYPIPRSVVYDGGIFEMTDTVNIVYEEAIDEYTQAFLEEVLSEYGVNYEKSTQAADDKTNILLGVKGSEGVADSYISEQVSIEDTDLFEQIDPYVLSAKDDIIAIVGDDTDSTFYGIATLQMMLTSFDDDTLLNVQIEDYAGIEYRGFIEGFYGGWDYPARENLMRFARDIKMNNYVYASKTDPYHTSAWNQLYPQSDIEKIAELVEVGKQTKCYYAWSVHISGFFSGLNTSDETAYEVRYAQLIAKFQQLYDAGVRKFDILNDDFGAGTNADVVKLLNRLTKEFLEPNGCEPLTYCMQGYNVAWSGNGAELNDLRALDDSIILYWTGSDVNSPITQESIDYVADRTGKKVCFWLNYPVNEHAKAGVYLGDITHYARDGVTGLTGAVSNPSRFAESNKVGLFQLASLFWNNTDYSEHAQMIWEDSFRYIQPEVKDAYFILASNIANCPRSSRVGQGFPESEYIREELENVLAKVNAGQSIEKDEEAATLLAAFDEMLSAIEEFKVGCESERLVDELTPWMDSLKDVASGGKAIIQSVIACQKEDVNTAWEQFGIASKSLKTWNSYANAYDAQNNPIYSEAGSKRLQPFLAKMVAYVKNNLTPLFDSSNTEVNPSFYAVLAGTPRIDDDNSAKIFDDNPNTAGQWNQVQKLNDYYGVDLGRVVPIKDIYILQGNSDTDHDIFHKAVLEYSEDGENFIQIGERFEDAVEISFDGLEDIKARYIRLRLVEVGTDSKPDYWTHVREFVVNRKVAEAERVYTNVEALKEIPLTVSGKEFSVRNLKNLSLETGEYVGIKMTQLASVTDITTVGTGLDKLSVQYSMNGIEWEDAKEFAAPQTARYLRLINNTQSTATCTLKKLGMSIGNLKISPVMSETSFTNALREGAWENMFDGDESTYAWTNQGQNEGDYIIADLGVTAALYDVTVVTWDGKARLYDAQLQVSADKENWTTIAEVEDDNSVFEVPYRYVRGDAQGMDARYIRILVTDDVVGKYDNPFLRIHEIEINKTVEEDNQTAAVIGSVEGELEKCADKDISTLFTVNGETKDGDYLEYRLTENTKLKAFSVLQDSQAISDAVVKVRTVNGYEEVGILDQSAKTFEVSDEKNILAIRLEWSKGKTPSIYEIFTDAAGKDTDDIGVYVEHLIGDEGDIEEPTNLALHKPVTVSGTSDGAKENVTDGTDAKWDSDFIKGAGAAENAWVYVDLGADKVSTISKINMKYFNKVYPTKYQIQVSDDAASWTTVESIQKEHNGPVHPVDTVTFESPVTGRYVRLFFEELNNVAAGNGVGLVELEVIGTQKAIESSDKTALEEALAQAAEIDTAIYTNASVAVYEAKKAEALDVYEDEEANQEEIDAKAAELLSAMEALVVKVTKENENLSLHRPIEVSGTSNGRPEYCVDGDASTKWDSDLIKGPNKESDEAWLTVDLGAGTALVEKITVKYFNLVFPTDYDILVSADKENWTIVDTRGYEHGAAAHPTDVIEFDSPVAAKYVKFLFREMNSSAAGHGIGINEVTVEGKRINEEAVVSGVEALDAVSVEKGITKEEAASKLPANVKAELAVKAAVNSGNEYLEDTITATMPVTWDVSEFDGSKDSTWQISGAVSNMGSIAAADVNALVEVIVGTGKPEEPGEIDTSDLQALVDYAGKQMAKDAYASVIPAVRNALEAKYQEAKDIVDGIKSVSQDEVNQVYKELLALVHMLDFMGGDSKPLQILVKEVEDLYLPNIDNYTEETAAALQNAYNEALKVLEDGENALAGDIEAARTALQKAKDELVEKEVITDKSRLEQLVAQAEGILAGDTGKYTEESVATLTSTLAVGQAVLENKDASQGLIDAAADTLEAAINGLSEKAPDKQPADKSALIALYEEVKDTDVTNYTDVSANLFQAALNAAAEVIANETLTEEDQDVVDRVKDTLQAAFDGLTLKETPGVEKEALKKLIDKSVQYVNNEAIYTEESFVIFKAAYDAALMVYNDEAATQEEVDAARATLEAARRTLREIPNKDKLEELIGKIKEVDLSLYTAKTAKAVKAAYAKAMAVFEDENATQVEIDEAVKALEKVTKEINADKKAAAGTQNSDDNKKVASDNSGKTSTTNSKNQSGSVKTGDDSAVIMILMLFGMSAAAIAMARKKKAI